MSDVVALLKKESRSGITISFYLLHYLANAQGRFAFYSTRCPAVLLTAVPIFIFD
ncbi:hypothetical protein C900_00229 [Fulvivirga imtechensis AK7]|uniref:Uncharacterized protein n=1 Tax=Fulvivirga imtechensis AK7 TaxID=1237149 RepID=L8JI81_9BACT|nr:hypothetical protein C900_00229 [Fulvivirga imtechensis AK7]